MRSALVAVSAVALSGLSLVGCGGGVDYSGPWRVTAKSLDTARAEADFLANLSVTDTDVVVGVDVTVNCLEAGTVTIVGDLTQTVDTSGVLQSFSYEATFDGCTDEGQVVDGTLLWEMEQSVGLDGVYERFYYYGDLSYSGREAIECVVEVESEVQVGEGVSVSYEGSFCGADAAVSIYVD